jgi:hypothetical protein
MDLSTTRGTIWTLLQGDFTVKHGLPYGPEYNQRDNLNIPVFWDATLCHVQVLWRWGRHDPYKRPSRCFGDMATPHKTGILRHNAVAISKHSQVRIGSSLSSNITSPTSNPLSAHLQHPTDPHTHPSTCALQAVPFIVSPSMPLVTGTWQMVQVVSATAVPCNLNIRWWWWWWYI